MRARYFLSVRYIAVLTLLLVVAACGGRAKAPSTSSPKAVEDIYSMTLEYDGTYRVVCRDGRVELRSPSEIRANRVCESGGGGGGNGILQCVARDNDGSNPWILARFSEDGQFTRFPQFVFSTQSQCQDAANNLVRVGFDTLVFCSTRDSDGSSPWSYGLIRGSNGTLATQAVFQMHSQCQDSLRHARIARDFLLSCTSRDADGGNPWVFVTVHSAGQVVLNADAVYTSFGQCLASL